MPKVPRSQKAQPSATDRNNARNGSARRTTPDPGAPTAVFRMLLDNLEIGIAQSARDGRILYANQRFVDILGRPERDLTDLNLAQFIAPQGWPFLSNALVQAAEKPVQGMMNVVTAGNSKHEIDDRMIRLSFWPLRDLAKTTIGIVATEVTHLVETKKALEKSEASLQSMSSRLLQVQDEERRRLARDLHDTTGQELSVVIMSLEHLAKEKSADTEQKPNVLAECVQQLRKVEKDVRTLSYVLHPPLLDEMGLAVALRWYLDGYSKRTGIEVDAEIPDSVPRFELEKETALFRVIQESLVNVYRHSGSPRARVRLRVEPSSIEAFVEDRGHGFSADVSAKPKPGVGIQSMKGRLEIVGGTLEVRSGDRGTTVTASVPIERRELLSCPLPESKRPKASEKPSPKRILIADDHYVARRGIRTLFDSAEDLEICGEAADGIEAVQRAKELRPDLVIMDLSMPKLGGLAAAGMIRSAAIGAKILVYTSHSLPQLEKSVRLAGCDGYVVKSNASHDLLRATREVLSGGKFYRSEMASGQSA